MYNVHCTLSGAYQSTAFVMELLCCACSVRSTKVSCDVVKRYGSVNRTATTIQYSKQGGRHSPMELITITQTHIAQRTHTHRDAQQHDAHDLPNHGMRIRRLQSGYIQHVQQSILCARDLLISAHFCSSWRAWWRKQKNGRNEISVRSYETIERQSNRLPYLAE